MRIPSPSPLLFATICLVLFPASVQAQGVITGQIDDSTGTGLPGVIVDAIGVSPFDEGIVIRVAVTAGENGHYRLDLVGVGNPR